MTKRPFITGKVLSDLEKIDKLLSIYSLMKNIKIRGFEREILVYYLKYGYSEETKKIISEDTGKKINYINVTNTKLRDLGLMEKGVNNERKSCLSAEMENLREQFVLKGSNGVFVGFKYL